MEPSPNHLEAIVVIIAQPVTYPCQSARLTASFKLMPGSQPYDLQGGAAIAALLARELRGRVMYQEIFLGPTDLGVLDEGIGQISQRDLRRLARALVPDSWDNSVTPITLLGRVRAMVGLVGLISAAGGCPELQEGFANARFCRKDQAIHLAYIVQMLWQRSPANTYNMSWWDVCSPSRDTDLPTYRDATDAYYRLLSWRDKLRLLGWRGIFGS